jgi:pyruvate-formate lyase-activating enzyme
MGIFFSLDQFIDAEKVADYVDGEILRSTVSLCHSCYGHIPAYLYHKDNQVWLVKRCRLHGISHHKIENDYEFYSKLKYKTTFGIDKTVMIEVTDRCNVDCPHCYHRPDNTTQDKPIEEIINQVNNWNIPNVCVCFAGAEPTVRTDIVELIYKVKNETNCRTIGMLTNGIRFSNAELLKQCVDAGLDGINIGLNHPTYLDNKTIREKQIRAITNCKELGIKLNHISYTMASISELNDILEEICISDWTADMYRIRFGADIGKYPEQPRMYVSDMYKSIKDWCKKNNKIFEDLSADNNIYHVMVRVDGKDIRIIQWCDETDIDLEELRTGPWCDFVGDGITNFLHQIIRRDVSKNKDLTLPDTPPLRYLIENQDDDSLLDFSSF